jgi:hypothetical protein
MAALGVGFVVAVCLTAGGRRQGAATRKVGSTTFTEHVLPIMEDKCLRCHRPDGVAPFDFGRYQEAAKRAQTIAYVTIRRQMPPCGGESEVAQFCRIAPLTQSQLLTIKQWADEGAAEGPPRRAKYPPAPEWPDFTPTQIIEVRSKVDIPADGPPVLQEIPIVVDSRLAGTWSGFSLSRSKSSQARWAKLSRSTDVALATSAIGYRNFVSTAGAFTLQKGQKLSVRVVFHPSGKARPGIVRLGFLRSTRDIAASLVVKKLEKPRVTLAPGERAHREDAELVVETPAKLVAIIPRLRFFCKSLEVTAKRPDQPARVLLKISSVTYWGRGAYNFAEAVSLTPGEVIRAKFEFDNSERNPVNPFSPPRAVSSGVAESDVRARVDLICIDG